jgi:hypothetical protein
VENTALPSVPTCAAAKTAFAGSTVIKMLLLDQVDPA